MSYHPNLPPKDHEDFVWIINNANESGPQKPAHCKYCKKTDNLEWLTYQVNGATKWILAETKPNGRIFRHSCEEGKLAISIQKDTKHSGGVKKYPFMTLPQATKFKKPDPAWPLPGLNNGLGVEELKAKVMAMIVEHQKKYAKQNWHPKKTNL